MKAALVALMLALALVGSGRPAAARARTPEPSRIEARLRVLPNGLRLYSMRDRRAPNVAVQVWYGVGAKNDPPGRSGFAHLFEHLMYKGARDPAADLNRLTEDVGGESNASTDDDYTEFHEVIPAGSLERLLWAEAERMSRLVVDAQGFASERAVVEDELRQQVLADPYGRLFEFDIPRASFTVHPYRRSPIGSMAELDAATLRDVKAFHALYYRPDNATLVVVGDFDPQRLDAWVDRYFGPIARPGRPIPRVAAREPPRTAPRAFDSYSPSAPLPAVVITYAAPSAGSRDAAALKVLDAILTLGSASRLDAALVHRRRLATDVFSEADLRQQAGLFYVGAVLADGVSIGRGEAALRAELARLRRRKPTTGELRRAKNQLMAGLLKDRESLEGAATAIGRAAVVEGDAGRANADPAALKAVTPGDVERVARAYLVDARRVTIRYHGAGWRPAQAGADLKGEPARAALEPPSPDAERRPGRSAPQEGPPPPPSGRPAATVPPKAVERTLANGLKVIVARTGKTQIATGVLVIRGGSALDPADKAGLADLTAQLCEQGAGARSPLGLAGAVEALGLTLSTESDAASTRFTLTGLSASLGPGLRLLADVARRPALRASELVRLRQDAAEDQAESLRDPGSIAELAAAPLVFGRGPLGRVSEGTPQSLARVTLGDAVREWKRLYRPDNAVLVLTGDIEPRRAFALARRTFGGWRRPPGAPPAAAATGASPKGRTIVVDLPGAREATVMVAGRSAGRLDPGHYAVEVAVNVLGGGYTSRLNNEIRVRRGLTYDAGGALEPFPRAGLFAASAETANARAPEVAALMLAQLKALAASAPPADELAAREAALVGEFGRRAQKSESLAELLARDAALGLGPNELGRYPGKVAQVTAAEVKAAAARLADPAGIDLLVAGDAKAFLPALKARFPGVEVIQADRLDLASASLR